MLTVMGGGARTIPFLTRWAILNPAHNRARILSAAAGGKRNASLILEKPFIIFLVRQISGALAAAIVYRSAGEG